MLWLNSGYLIGFAIAVAYESLLYHVRLALFEFDANSVFLPLGGLVLPVSLCLHMN